MDEVAGQEVAGGVPKTLLKMLNTLEDDFGLRSYQIYTDSLGVSVRIRFGLNTNVGRECSQAGHADNNTHSTACKQKHITYGKRPPAQQRRESARCILRAKRQRTIDQHFTNTENERNSDDIVSPLLCDSPVNVTCERSEESVFLAPIIPLEMEMPHIEIACKLPVEENVTLDICEELEVIDTFENYVKCPCCGTKMKDAFHTCSLESTLNGVDDLEIVEMCVLKHKNDEKSSDDIGQINAPKLNKVYNLYQTESWYTYCSLYQSTKNCHSGKEYHFCTSCTSYLCFTCFA